MADEHSSPRSPSFSVPLVLLSFATYSFLNFAEVFVKHLGCGCAPGFNTNSLTMAVGAIGVLLVALDVANAFRHRSWQLQWLQTGATFGLMLPLWFIFVSLNSWM